MTTEAQSQNGAFGIPDNVGEPVIALDAFGFPKKYLKISIYEDRAKGAESVCKVSLNGRAFLMRRGVVHIVPSVVVAVLDEAVQEVTVQSEGGLITRPALRFPYQNHGEATEAEYIAYQEKMSKERQARALQATA